jgi:hypothetical protein
LDVGRGWVAPLSGYRKLEFRQPVLQRCRLIAGLVALVEKRNDRLLVLLVSVGEGLLEPALERLLLLLLLGERRVVLGALLLERR